MPGQANTVSTSTEPPISCPAWMPARVTTGSSALRRMWRRRMRPSGTPLARAVLMKSWPATLQHGAAGQPGVDGHVEQAERQRGQHQVARRVGRRRPAVQVRPHGVHAEARQPVEPDAEHQHQHQADPEDRRGVEAERQHGDEAVGPAADPPRGRGAERDAAARAKAKATPVSSSVAGRRSAIRLTTVRCWRCEMPRSPRATALTYSQSCVPSGLSRPNSWRSCSTKCAIRGPGLPGHDAGRVAGGGVDQQEVHADDREHQEDHLHQPPGKEAGEAEGRHAGLLRDGDVVERRVDPRCRA